MVFEELKKEALSISVPNYRDNSLKINVIGIGGGGSNTVTRLKETRLEGIDLMAVNTDKRHLMTQTNADKKIIIGEHRTRGNSAGGNLEVGAQCAEDARSVLAKSIGSSDITFVLASLGGGTGSGAGPVIADIAKKSKSLVISIVTMPFETEGRMRIEKAKIALEQFHSASNTVIVLDNNRLLKMVPNLPLNKAFEVMDILISDIIQNITETITIPSRMNIDFADLNSVMHRGGTSTILYGEGSNFDAQSVILDTLNNPFMDIDYSGASAAIVHITASEHTSLTAITKVVSGIVGNLNEDVEVKFGVRFSDEYSEKMKVTTILTGLHTPFLSNKDVSIEGNVFSKNGIINIIS